MLSSQIQTERIQQLQKGDRVKYRGILWQVKAYSTYSDPTNGYETAEWQLRSQTAQEYYLLREIDPQNSENILHWYLAEEINQPNIFLPNSQDNIVNSLWLAMQQQQSPYQELQMFGISYYFESQTDGNYQSDEANTSRMTWDYWDRPHQQNLAMEAWSSGELHCYLSKVVNPEEFSEFKKVLPSPSPSFPLGQFLAASAMVIVGILLVIFG